MRFQKGNELWKLGAHKSGAPRRYNKGEDLWKDCTGYFQWCIETPIIAFEPNKFKGETKLAPIPKIRAMTYEGLHFYLGIHHSTWIAWRSDPVLSETVARVEQVMAEQKISGAMAEQLNPNIVSRYMKLSDRTEVTGRDGGPIETKNLTPRLDSLTDDQLAALEMFMLSGEAKSVTPNEAVLDVDSKG